MTLVRIIKNWDWPDLMRQTPGGQGIWDNIQFTVDPVEECDFVIMLNNNMKCGSIVKCPKENIWALMQEPYVKGFTDWMAEGHESFSHVYTHYIPSNHSRYIVSQPALPWHINKSFDQLSQMDIPAKSKVISWIAGNAMDIPGHIKRRSFLQFMKNNASADIDLFGRAVRVIEDKWDGLAPYKYSLAIENSPSPNYWTEKLADCFLTWTIPFYFGCPNLETYFPEESFIRIDIDKPRIALDRIKSAIKNNEWEKRLPALKAARERVLNQYQLFPHLAERIKSHHTDINQKSLILIPPYKRSINTRLNRAFFKTKMAIMRLRHKLK
ncbi:MAG TPA: glycosyltransferase family 10 [Smithella sp.]|nr:glycosyltransferase family 10 [Smithella sp.]